MNEQKAGVAVLVKSRARKTDNAPWEEVYLFGGSFESLSDSLNYLKFLEKRETPFIVQLGFVGWKHLHS